MTNNHIDYIEFKAHDLEKTKTFYSDLFGWEFTDYGPSYTSFAKSGVFGGFETTAEPIANGALIVLYHAELESVLANVEKAGGQICKAIFSFPGGRRFHFRDPSGNELAVWTDK